MSVLKNFKLPVIDKVDINGGYTYQAVSHIVFDLGDEWYTEFLKFTLPVFLTFNQVKEEEVNITRAYLQIKVNHYPSYVRIVSLS